MTISLTVLVPLTYAAAVRYGWDEWAWANRKNFDDALRGTGSAWNNEWKSRSNGQAGVCIHSLQGADAALGRLLEQ
jgi:hypothetical protein